MFCSGQIWRCSSDINNLPVLLGCPEEETNLGNSSWFFNAVQQKKETHEMVGNI